MNAADFSTRPAAPGSLVSVLGGPVSAARAGDLQFPILDSSASGTQMQVPFEVSGTSVGLSLDAASGTVSLGLAVQPASPAIFIDRDGAPMLLDADTGLDARRRQHRALQRAHPGSSDRSRPRDAAVAHGTCGAARTHPRFRRPLTPISTACPSK